MSIVYKDMTEFAENICKNIVNTIRRQGIKVRGRVVYNGSAIEIMDNNCEIHMWTRLIWNNTFTKATVQISTVNFSEKYQRQGLFTMVINSLKRNKYVENIMIQSVISYSMRSWCRKHRFHKLTDDELVQDYYWKAF